jgi:hypothetical protein
MVIKNNVLFHCSAEKDSPDNSAYYCAFPVCFVRATALACSAAQPQQWHGGLLDL